MKYVSDIISEIFTWCHRTIAAPTLLSAVSSPPDIILSWTDNADNNTCFNIWRSTDGTNFTLIDTIGDLEGYTDTTTETGITYWYKVQACDEDGNTSDFSNTVIETGVGITEIHYGLLYNWYAATDVRNIANDGWHVSTHIENQVLETYLGGAAIAGAKLKETGIIYWLSPNSGSTNEVGFNARGSGYRNGVGGFSDIRRSGFLFASDGFIIGPTQYGYVIELIVNADNSFSGGGVPGVYGHSVRVVKDTTTLTHGQTGTYTGNDGKIYRTICIGTQEWLADNLCETLYRNGDLIPEVTDDAAWAGLSTGALCAYDNDWGNV